MTWKVFRAIMTRHWPNIAIHVAQRNASTIDQIMLLDRYIRDDYEELLSLRVHNNFAENDDMAFSITVM